MQTADPMKAQHALLQAERVASILRGDNYSKDTPLANALNLQDDVILYFREQGIRTPHEAAPSEEPARPKATKGLRGGTASSKLDDREGFGE